MSFGGFNSGGGGGFGNSGGGGFGNSGGSGGSLFGGGNSGGGFGASNTGGGFGASNNSGGGFGASNNSGGGFGASNNSGGGGFGSSNSGSSFGFGGGNNNSGGGFGSSNTGGSFGSSNTGGGFGSSNTGGGFGSSNTGGGFGSTNTGGGFGSTNTGGGFGSNTSFGSPSQPANNSFGSGGSFGSSNTGGGFGSSNAGGGFGSTNTGGGFGSTNTGGGFGSNNTGGGSLFGGSSTSNNSVSFGGFNSSSTSAGGFGSSNATGGFGASNSGGGFNAGSTGTTVEFQPTVDSASSSNEVFMTILAMNQYANKSAEQLRLEDYSAGRRPGSTQGNSGQPASGGFGAPASGGGLFGSNNTNANSGGLFGGGGNSGTSFGASNNNGGGALFGSSGNTNSFGTSSSSGGMFGSSNTSTSGFGSTSTGFGSNTQTNSGGGLFGGGNNTNSSGGGLFGGGGNQNTNTGGGLFGGGGNTNTAGGFGSNQPQSGGLFGSSNSQASSGGLFGGNTANNNTFGNNANNSGGGLFGSTNNNPSGGFGSSNASGGGLFGGSNTGTAGQTNQFGSSGGSLFGGPTATNNTSGGLFGGSNNNAGGGGGLFGSSNNTSASGGGLFGSTNTNTSGGGLFGSSTAAPNTGGGLFGGSAGTSGGGGLFGSSSAAPANGGGGLFGGSGTSTGFGSSNTTGGGGLFGSSGNTSNTFGSANTSGGGLFGSTTTNNTAGGGLFGNSGTSSFMQSSQPQQQPMQNQMQPNNQLLMQQQMLALTQGEPYAMGPSSQMARHIALANEAWNPEPNSEDKSRDVDDDSDRLGRHSGSVVKSDKTKTPGHGVGSTPIGKVQIRPRGYGRTYGAVASMVGSDAASAPGSSLRSARTVSAAAPSTPGPSNGNVKTATDKAKQDKPGNGVLTPGVFDLNKRLSIKKSNRKNTPLALSSSQNVPAIENVDSEDSHSQYRGGASSSDDENKSYDDSLKTPSRTGGAKSHGKPSSTPLHDEEGVYDTPDRLALSVDKGNIRSSTVTRSARRKGPLSEHCPRMSEAMMDAGYTTSPSMRDLMGMTDEELKSVSNFRIERDKYGSVQWVGKVDVRDLDIDAVVTIEEMSIEVYPDEDGTPERGTKLNRPAICVLSHVEIPNDFEGAKEDFAQWVKETYQPLLKDTTFISYDVETSDWCFKVEHFTRYAFNTDASTPYPRSARGRRAREVSREEPLTPGLHGRDDEMDRLEVDDDRGSMGEFSSPEDLNGGTTGSNTYDDRFNVDAGHDEFRHQQPGHQAHMLNALPAGLQNVPPLRGFRFNQARPLANQELGRDPFGAIGHGDDDDDDDDVDIEGAGLYSVTSIRPEPILFNELNELPIEDGPTFAIFRNAGGDGRLLQGGLGELDRTQRPPIRKLHRPFRASWGANGRLVFAKGSRVQLMKVNVDDPTPSDGERIRIVMDACKMHVANTRAIQNEEDDDMRRVEHSANCVLATAVDNLLRHAQPSPSFGASSTEVEVKVWSLIKNSWFVGGPCVPDPSIAESVEMTWESWYEALPRRSETAVCNQRRIRDEWLDSHDTWLKEHLTNEAPEYLGDVAGALSLKCIEQASDLAIERGDFRLATLISQAAGDCKVRDLLRRQLELWTENGAISHIDDELVNIYQMLAGNVQEEQRKKPWLRALALNSWYAHDPLANLAQGMGTYQSAFMAGYAPSPRPTWYSQKHDCTNCFDTVYQVLQLACSPNTHPMADVLNPRGYSGNMLTYGMSWTLWHILKSFGVFGGMLSSLQEHQLGMNYILELEAKGSWTWAVAVAMFLPEPAKREEAARALLDRHFSASSETSIFFQELGIPQTWIAYSAAFRQGYSANIGVDAFESRCAEAESYGLAGDLARRCQVIDEHLATPAILNGNTSLLYKMLRPDEESIQRTAVTTRARWACRCLVYLEYACLRERLRNIEEDDIFDFRDSCRKLQMDLIALQSNRTIALHSALAAEIGTWLQLRATEILRSTGTDHSTDPSDYEAPLLVPAHETVLRTAVARLTVSFIESF